MHFVNTGMCKQPKRCLVMGILLLAFLAGDRCVLMAEADSSNGVLRSRAFKLYHITSRQAAEMLSRLNIGDSYDELSDNVLIVTSGRGADLIRATEVMTVLDQPGRVDIWVLLVGSDQQPLPNLDVLSAQLRAFSVGTMRDAPPKGATNPLILDILDNKLIAIADEELLPEVQKVVDAWKAANPPKKPSPQPEETEETAETIIRPAEPEAEETEAVEEGVPAVMGQPQESPLRSVEDLPDTSGEPAEPMEPAEVEQDLSLQEIMTRLLEQEKTAIPEAAPMTQPAATAEDDLTGMLDETEPNTTDEFIGNELLRVLLDEEKKSRPQPPKEHVPPEVETAARPEPKSETEQVTQPAERGEEKTLKEAIEMLLKETPEEETGRAEPPTAEEPIQPGQIPQRSEAVSEKLRLQRQIAILRQQLAEAQAQRQQQAEPPDLTDVVEIEPEVEEPQPEVLTEKESSAQVEFEKQVGEAELETVMNIPQEVELENLVDLVGKQLGLNYMYDPAIFRNQKVFLKIHEGTIKVKNLYGLLESVLRFRGFVMTRRGDLVTIIKSADVNQVAQQTDTVFRMPGDPIQPGDIIVSTIFRLNHVGTDTAKNMLSSMKLGLGNGFQEIPETNTLIVTDYAYRMPRIEEVLEMIDVAGEEKIFKYRALKYMQAADMVDKLKELVSEMEGVSMQVTTEQAAPTRFTTQRRRNPQTGRIETVRVPVQTPQQQAGGQADEDTVFIDTDDRTNRILMIGTQAQIEIINQLVDTLDVPQFNLKFVREYVIQHVEAIEVVNVLNELGLADLQVSGAQSAETSAAARRAAAARRRQPNQPQQPAETQTPSVSGGGDQPSIAIRPATNSLLVNGTEEQHEAIELVIAHVDVVQKDQRTIREYEIQYVDTQEIIDTMTELGIISADTAGTQTTQRGRTGRTTRSRTAQPQTVQGEGAAPPQALTGLSGEEGAGEDITAQEPQIAVLEATNSLLVFATPRQHRAISLLIAHADRVPETTTTPYVVYALENQDPLELSEVLTKLIQETVEEVGPTQTPESRVQTARTGAAAAGPVPNLEEEKIRIIPDEMSYSLIVYANKRNQQWISELIDELDEYRPQVLLDCTLVEITKDDAFNYSLNLVGKTYDGSALQTGTPVTQPTGVSSPFSSSTLGDASTISGNVTAFLNTGSVQAVLTAIQENGYGRVMAQPKLLVNDNQEGTIQTNTTRSVPQVQTETTFVNEVQNTSESVTFSTYDQGVMLTIRPHISKGDMLRLEITLNRTDFFERGVFPLGGEEYPIPPDLLSTDVTTIATVPDGTTIVLGGLESVSQSKSQDKVPILGDLPLVGTLFRGVDNSDEQSKLYVFVKANVIRPGDEIGGLKDIRRVSSKYRAEFEQMEREFQGLQDFPGVDPEPMDPLQVLELEPEIPEYDEING